MKTRYGCLVGVLAVAVVGAWATWTADWGDDGAGTRLAVGLACGLIIIYLGRGIEWLGTRSKHEPQGFPIEPRRRDGDA
jgi:hypothetical protein